MKHRTSHEKKRRRHLIVALSIATVVFVSALLVSSMLNNPVQTSELKAAIVDQLSLTYPNQTFAATASNLLRQAGYIVDYYRGELVTVDFYRELPTRGYRIVILRVHSSSTTLEGSQAPVTLFTTEPYSSTRHVYEQLTDQVKGVAFSRSDASAATGYFGITPAFVTQSMRGRFQESIVVVMGCEGLANNQMAEAFVGKGAKAYVSWSDSVLASHTDVATTHLLSLYLQDNMGLREAVGETMNVVGPDLVYNSYLQYYPAA